LPTEIAKRRHGGSLVADDLLRVEGLRKSFGGIAALKDGRFTLQAGQVKALCGGNGAGKSTFLSIVMGIQPRDGGVIRRAGRQVNYRSPREARADGISIIEQELSPVPAMTVAENIFLGREPTASFGRVDFRKMNREAQALLDGLHFDIDARAMMMDLTVGKLQLVEIARALSYDAEIIIMDEPTSALGEAEADQLFEAIGTLKARGKGVIYVTHRLSEVFEVADSYTVFRDGAFVGEGAIADITRDDLIRMIVGRPLTEEFYKENVPSEDIALELRGINSIKGVSDIDLVAHRGEILAVFGLMGSGRTELFERVFGLVRDRGGEIRIGGVRTEIRTPEQAIANGIALVTEDRKGSGLVLTASVRENICMAWLKKLGFGPVMNFGAEARAARRMIEMFNIKAGNDRDPVSSLSGGNQQKVVLGRWFLTEPAILLLDEPTRGVDVGAKREIYRIMSDFAARGGTVIMISSETDEVIGMADRALVMRDGRIAGEIPRAALSAERLISLAA
jgi:putative xylitol transport system ATP-binding protein